MRYLITLTALAAALSSPDSARADLIIDIQSISVDAGDTGFVDVLVSSDSATGDSFNYFFLDFVVDLPVEFIESPSIPADQLFADTANGDPFSYVFLNDSSEAKAEQDGIDFVDTIGSQSFLTATDEKDSGADHTITSADGQFLLARLNFIASGPGDFAIELDLDTSIFEDASGTGFFSDLDGNLTFNSGTVSVAAVPEPSAFALLILGSLCLPTPRRKRLS